MEWFELFQTIGICVGSIALLLLAFSAFLIAVASPTSNNAIPFDIDPSDNARYVIIREDFDEDDFEPAAPPPSSKRRKSRK